MAENVEGQTKVEEKVVPPVEGETPAQKDQETPPEREFTEIEQQAIEQGWDPDFDGPTKRSAREFLDRGELLSKIRSQSQELTKVKEVIGALTEHNKQVYRAGYEKAINDLRSAKVAAMEAQDHKAVVQIDQAIDNTKDELRKLENQPTLPAKQGPTPEFQHFVATNKWYQNDASMRHWAHGMAIEFGKVNPDATEADVYKFIEKEVRRKFPQDFSRSGPPSPDGQGKQAGSKTAKSGADKFTALMNELPEDQARAAKEMVKRGILTKEKYVEDYESIRRN